MDAAGRVNHLNTSNLKTMAPISSVELPPGTETITVKMINPVNFGPAILKRFMAPDVPGLETFATSPSLCFFLEHPSGRRLVWDLGIRKDYDHYAPSIKDYLPTTKYTIEVTKNVVEILQEHGIELNSIEAVIWRLDFEIHLPRQMCHLYWLTLCIAIITGITSATHPLFPGPQNS